MMGRGEDGQRASLELGEEIQEAAQVEVQRKISFLRREGLTPDGRQRLVARGLLRRGEAQERLLEWEASGAKSGQELAERWARCQVFFEAHMYRNVQAFVFNDLRRAKSLPPAVARSA